MLLAPAEKPIDLVIAKSAASLGWMKSYAAVFEIGLLGPEPIIQNFMNALLNLGIGSVVVTTNRDDQPTHLALGFDRKLIYKMRSSRMFNITEVPNFDAAVRHFEMKSSNWPVAVSLKSMQGMAKDAA